MDPVKFLADLAAGQSGSKLRLGMARVRSVDSDGVYTISSGQAVIVPSTVEVGAAAIVANYLGEYPPRPGGSVWYVTDGVDRIILGMMAPDGPPAAGLTMSAAQSLTSGSVTYATWGSVLYDPWNMSGAAATALTIPADGYYSVVVSGQWASNGSGYRDIRLTQNGTVIQTGRAQAATGAATFVAAAVPSHYFAKGDIVNAAALQNSGIAVNFATAAELRVQYVGRRRSTTGYEFLYDGGFEDNNLLYNGQWETFYAQSATWTTDIAPNTTGTASKFSLKGVTTAGTTGQSVTNNAMIPVYPGMVIRVTGSVKTSAALAGGTWDNVHYALLCNALGTPDYYTADGTVEGANAATGTAFATLTQDLTVPANCYVARVSLRSTNTAGVTIWWDDISAKELIR